jgi:hypothetical protein
MHVFAAALRQGEGVLCVYHWLFAFFTLQRVAFLKYNMQPAATCTSRLLGKLPIFESVQPSVSNFGPRALLHDVSVRALWTEGCRSGASIPLHSSAGSPRATLVEYYSGDPDNHRHARDVNYVISRVSLAGVQFLCLTNSYVGIWQNASCIDRSTTMLFNSTKI